MEVSLLVFILSLGALGFSFLGFILPGFSRIRWLSDLWIWILLPILCLVIAWWIDLRSIPPEQPRRINKALLAVSVPTLWMSVVNAQRWLELVRSSGR